MISRKFDLKIENKIKTFNKSINVDPDKSISIRSLLISSISQNCSSIKNILESEDVKSCLKCIKKLGIKIQKKNKEYLVFGKGLGSLSAKKNIRMTGDRSLNKRSMKTLINIMNKFGASFYPKNKFNFPLKLKSSNMPVGINFTAGVSAQIKSAVIFAGLNSYGDTKIIETYKSRDHTENMLVHNNQSIKIQKTKNKIIKIFGKKKLKNIRIKVPGDPSSAAFFAALTILNNNSRIKIKDVGLNPTRIGFYKLLKKHGAKVKFTNIKKNNNELRGDITVNSCKIKPIYASKDYYVNSTDEYPILFVIAALTKGTSVFKGINDLANKESNRIIEMQKVLKQLGIKSLANKDSLKIFGKDKIDIKGKKINVANLGDHRICMSSFVLGLITGAKTQIKNFETVFTSAPNFLNKMKLLGAKFDIQK